MESPKLTPERAELIINLLRDNPGVSMTLADIADATELALPDVAAHLEELIAHDLVLKETDSDGFDRYQFPQAYQRGTMAP